ncbi:hypothetical protein A1O3_02892 [Capronia epimyces CBS 606.96]|uniref:Mitochondrial import inner membrane translocase subunit n=1 Tax=Capronia epimyces CBS 606.96 TaxID=1182542 RepID=W9YJE6_9EURO|nr:uncharacterized protein A1O3_02892 [Capronia epimyces CBS 606.96]EXJ89825.1 hypothetical protein A1O3_02892 [Capronia epimyces CBS 606.96]
MSFLFGGGRPQPSSAEKIAAAEAEIMLVQEMFHKSVASCKKKCVPNDYREAELNKAESVCLDRCMAKFIEVNMQISDKLKQNAPGGGGGGMFGV